MHLGSKVSFSKAKKKKRSIGQRNGQLKKKSSWRFWPENYFPQNFSIKFFQKQFFPETIFSTNFFPETIFSKPQSHRSGEKMKLITCWHPNFQTKLIYWRQKNISPPNCHNDHIPQKKKKKKNFLFLRKDCAKAGSWKPEACNDYWNRFTTMINK